MACGRALELQNETSLAMLLPVLEKTVQVGLRFQNFLLQLIINVVCEEGRDIFLSNKGPLSLGPFVSPMQKKEQQEYRAFPLVNLQ